MKLIRPNVSKRIRFSNHRTGFLSCHIRTSLYHRNFHSLMKRYHGRKNSQQNGSQQQVAKQDLYAQQQALILQDAVEAGICQQERTVIPSVAGSGILYGYILARSLYPRMQTSFAPFASSSAAFASSSRIRNSASSSTSSVSPRCTY